MSEPLIGMLQAVWSDIDSLCSDLTEQQWAAPTDCPGWTVHDQVAHMIGTENMLLGVQPPTDVGDVGDAPHIRNDIGKFNEQWVAAYRSRSGADTLADFRAVTALRTKALAAMTSEEWDEEGFTPEGPGPYRQFMAIRVFDCWYHDQDIREALGRPGFLDGPAADLTVERIVGRALPYVVGKKAGAPPSSSIVIEVAGDPTVVAAVGVPPEGRAALLADAPANPTATLTFDRRTFTRLAGGRWTGDRARATGVLSVAGDRVLGDRVVDNFAFTI
jgi:uncharacterized protein (TIGR03083 family)